jgi:class 3 adenylate cyclase
MGKLVDRYGGTLEHFAGDGVMIFFNDPVPVERPALQAVRMAIELQQAFRPIEQAWEHRGHQVALGVGVAQGEATLGVIGFEQRWEYAAIGAVPNLAARLCGQAKAGEILIDAVTYADVSDAVHVEPAGPMQLRGFTQPIAAFRVKGLK